VPKPTAASSTSASKSAATALRTYVLDSSLELSDGEINACFFMASPMVSIGSVSLYSGIKALL
jgi:hypothetical protein